MMPLSEIVFEALLIFIALVLSVLLMIQIGLVENPFIDHDENKPSSEQVNISTLTEMTYVLIISANMYEHQNLAKLEVVKNDTLWLIQTLKTSYKAQITYISDEGANLETIKYALSEFSKKIGKDDTAIFYYGGLVSSTQDSHGKNINFLYTYNSDPKRLPETSITFNSVKDFLSNITAKRMGVILDAYYPEKKVSEKDIAAFQEIPLSLPTYQIDNELETTLLAKIMALLGLSLEVQRPNLFTDFINTLNLRVVDIENGVRVRNVYRFK